MDFSVDLSFEKNFILNVISYIFAKNKIKIPRLLMEIMNESSCSKVYLFPSEVHNAVDVIMKAQENVFKFLTKESIDFYYKRRISSEKVFLEFTTFHSRICLLDTFDNPEAATDAYNSMMKSLTIAKQRSDFIFNQDKLVCEAKKIVGQGLDRYIMFLLSEGDRIYKEAIATASNSPKEAYLVKDFQKVKTKLEILDKASGSESDEVKASEIGKNGKAVACGKSRVQVTKPEKVQSSKSENRMSGFAEDSEFVEVELDDPKSEREKKAVAKCSTEVATTGDLETVVRNENDLVEELLEAMEDIL